MATLKTANTRGKYHDPYAKEDLINYILNPQKARHYSCGYNVNFDNPADSMEQVSAHYNKTDGVQLRHFIISFHPTELDKPKIANAIAMQIAGFFVFEYQTVYAVHEDKYHLHIHMVINSVSYVDGHRYKGTKKEFYDFKNYLSEVLADYGIYGLRYISANHVDDR